ncbi:hypothetical protein [Micromonospora sp. WMMD710]|uniref:hypothetical protein n=1 Tax=Micromonospora sp. WMMD710 TaxID=3016085 RepID=UPI002417ABD9|nr:hypothetical protein [Micromonospora sp. WMMD710]MDG4759266.1 hypothetical protein [Micromonospora sp. WMMD710]
MVVLRGPPGVGKNALAVRWGHTRQDWFDGGQFYATFQEWPDEALGGSASTDDALLSFLLAMGVRDDLVPKSSAGRRSLFRTLSADKPVLVVLHGASLPAQISPLVPTAPGSVVLVSTQHDVRGLALDGAHMVDVEPLDEDAALRLLTTVCGDGRVAEDQVAAKRLVELCGRLPLAVRVIAGRLHLDPTMTVAALADEVAEEPHLLDAMTLPGGGDAVAHLFNNAYRSLSADAQRLYRDIGATAVVKVPDDLLARVGWRDRTVRRAAVEQLLGMGLLERIGRLRYTQHPLIRSHAARLAQDLTPSHAERVVTDSIAYVCEFAHFANQAIMGSRRWVATEPVTGVSPFPAAGGRAAALQALEEWREDLLRVARVASASGADRQVVWLAEAVTTALYFNHRHLADWVEMSRLSVAAARRLGRFDVEAQVRCTLSRAYADDGDLDKAEIEVEGALALLPQVDDPILHGTVWEFYGRYLDLAARAAPVADQPAARVRAEAAFRTAIDVYIQNGERRGAALGRLFLGTFLDATGRPAAALPYLELAREGFNDVDDDRSAARADAAIGAAHLHLGHYRQAFDELSAAAAYLATAQLWHYEAEVRDNLALAATALGDRAAAAEHSQRAADIRRMSGEGQ